MVNWHFEIHIVNWSRRCRHLDILLLLFKVRYPIHLWFPLSYTFSGSYNNKRIIREYTTILMVRVTDNNYRPCRSRNSDQSLYRYSGGERTLRITGTFRFVRGSPGYPSFVLNLANQTKNGSSTRLLSHSQELWVCFRSALVIPFFPLPVWGWSLFLVHKKNSQETIYRRPSKHVVNHRLLPKL